MRALEHFGLLRFKCSTIRSKPSPAAASTVAPAASPPLLDFPAKPSSPKPALDAPVAPAAPGDYFDLLTALQEAAAKDDAVPLSDVSQGSLDSFLDSPASSESDTARPDSASPGSSSSPPAPPSSLSSASSAPVPSTVELIGTLHHRAILDKEDEPSDGAELTPLSKAARENGTSSRRARFDASLSSSSSHLHATAPAFSPSGAAVSVAPSPAPANQTLAERLIHELSTEDAECSICADNLSRTARIHSCSQCYTPFHLACITKWAASSVASTAERAALLATRDPRNPPSAETLAGHWSCPNCNTQFPAAKVPKRYTCFCGRVTEPHPAKAGQVPHSCAKPCARKRPKGCKHPCQLGCHPGPCPPCPVVLNERCHCTSRTLQLRCSSLHPSIPPTSPTDLLALESLKSCHQPHGASLDCGLHACARECHAGPCGACDVQREKRCFCGNETAEGVCGATPPSERVEGCTRPVLPSPSDAEAADAPETWTGEFACARTCDAPYSCGVHRCTSSCHAHVSAAPEMCSRAPEAVTRCPCGKTALADLSAPRREKCTDGVPTCQALCGKVRECGHACEKRCHEGECGACTVPVPLTCRCGSSQTTRLCCEPYRASSSPSSSSASHEHDGHDVDIVDDPSLGYGEYKCGRVCKSMRSCGRHQCNRVCCPLAWQEALTAASARKGKKRALTAAQELDEMEAQDPEGIHRCDRTCGRKLNCGIHNCELKDHRGACPPCLRADFDELVCNCGSTVVLPPIPCNFVIDCRHPCIRPPECGHPQLPHACHEEPGCPPCPFLMAKPCACGKKRIPNVRCSMDERKVSCGGVCGKLLRCGWHRCRKVCHPAGECETVDDQMCLKPRKHCGHPCPLPCHFPSACSTESPCDKFIEVTCSCGNIKQKARCGSCDSKPEGNNGRLVKCTDACTLAKRNAQLADALGVEKKEAKVREVAYEPQTLSFGQANLKWALEIEAMLVEFVKSDKTTLHFPAMKRDQRQFVYELCEAFSLRGESVDPEPHRSIIAYRTPTVGVPSPSLADALAAQKKPAATLSLGSLRKALPERKPNNALYLEGVLGYDEESLADILRPHMRGLPFELTWVTDEDVLVTIDHPATFELDAKLSSISTALLSVVASTGFCIGAETVLLADDGRVVRGSWTPVAGSATTSSAAMSASSSASGTYPGVASTGNGFRPPAGIRTANAFERLGTSPPKQAVPAKNAWGSGSVIGAAHNRPPRAVVAPAGEQERFIPSPAVSRVPTPSLPPPPPVAKKHEQEDVPDAWDAEE
ncbi:hypothetical protein JCM10207_001449 [Rhodosporidiobolus poonsookiae]